MSSMSDIEDEATRSSPAKRLARQSQWRVVADRIELLSRPAVFRYRKLEKEDIDSIVRVSIRGDVEEDDVLYRKGIQKVKTNISTWKNQTLDCIKVNFLTSITLQKSGHCITIALALY